jgi:hypothetical protein
MVTSTVAGIRLDRVTLRYAKFDYQSRHGGRSGRSNSVGTMYCGAIGAPGVPAR